MTQEQLKEILSKLGLIHKGGDQRWNHFYMKLTEIESSEKSKRKLKQRKRRMTFDEGDDDDVMN